MASGTSLLERCCWFGPMLSGGWCFQTNLFASLRMLLVLEIAHRLASNSSTQWTILFLLDQLNVLFHFLNKDGSLCGFEIFLLLSLPT